ncbi:MAG: hypothetical protein II628_13270, partial [Lachnospiraceae bacterium]|nr:hypothetical protein [Lachnospiraceae bacterium]
PVDAAVEGKVRFLGIDSFIGGIVRQDFQLIIILQKVRDVRPEGGIAPVVDCTGLSVQDDLCR